MSNPRAQAARVLAAVIGSGITLEQALEHHQHRSDGRDRALVHEISFGVCRHYFELDAILAQLLERPLKARDADLRALLLAGLYQLRCMRVPDHAAVSETVAACGARGKSWARGLVNAVLRAYLARQPELEQALDEAQRHAHPQWLLDAVRSDWPDDWPAIIAANNALPPLTLRVNRRRGNRAQWLARALGDGVAARACTLADDGVMLTRATSVEQIPGFIEGAVSVQDEGAQLAAGLLDCRAGQRVLDACAAPGGKACHLLEREPGLRLMALDVSARRLARVRQNLERLSLDAQLVQGDAGEPRTWWDGTAFDRILVDAPCSGTGVIRRHPDIRVLRTPDQVAAAGLTQQRILARLWDCLAPGGLLLYVTCSVLSRENEAVIADFLAVTPDAHEILLDTPWGHARRHGRQLLPTIDAHDGFYYALLRRNGGGVRP